MAPILSHFPLLRHASALLAKISAQSWEGVSHSQALSLLDGLTRWAVGNKFLKAQASQFPGCCTHGGGRGTELFLSGPLAWHDSCFGW